MHCPTCRNRTLVAFQDLRGAIGGHCPDCRGRWCTADEAVALGVFARADLRSAAVAIGRCPVCLRQSLSPVDALRPVPVRPLHCSDCSGVWIAGATLDAIRNAAAPRDDTRVRGREVSHPLWARLKATYGADAQTEDDVLHDRDFEDPIARLHSAQDRERPRWTSTLAVPAVAVLIWILDGSEGLRFVLQSTLSMAFHEAGHAIAAWLTGRLALPLPFLTLSSEDPGPLAFLFSAGALGTMMWIGMRRGLPFWIGVAALGGWLLISKGLVADIAQQRLWISAAGVGGEFVLGTLCIVAFFHRLHRRPQWAITRYVALLVGMAVFVPSWLRWRRVAAGDEPFPLGSLIFGDSDGDMNRLLAAGLQPQEIVESYLGLGQLCTAAIFGCWLWMAWRAYAAQPRVR
jgi:Zn-finger nucleic acid-binding protein